MAAVGSALSAGRRGPDPPPAAAVGNERVHDHVRPPIPMAAVGNERGAGPRPVAAVGREVGRDRVHPPIPMAVVGSERGSGPPPRQHGLWPAPPLQRRQALPMTSGSLGKQMATQTSLWEMSFKTESGANPA